MQSCGVTAIHRRRISCGLESLSVKCSRVVVTAIHRRRISCGLESLSALEVQSCGCHGYTSQKD